jgi:hypothetical protein
MSIENIDTEAPKDILANDYDDVRAIEVEGYKIGVRRARNALFAIAALLLVGELISIIRLKIPFSEFPAITWLIILVEVGVFIGLALWTDKQPFLAAVIGIVLFIGLWIFTIIYTGFVGAIGGIVARVLILYYLFNSLKDAKALEASRKESY